MVEHQEAVQGEQDRRGAPHLRDQVQPLREQLCEVRYLVAQSIGNSQSVGDVMRAEARSAQQRRVLCSADLAVDGAELGEGPAGELPWHQGVQGELQAAGERPDHGLLGAAEVSRAKPRDYLRHLIWGQLRALQPSRLAGQHGGEIGSKCMVTNSGADRQPRGPREHCPQQSPVQAANRVKYPREVQPHLRAAQPGLRLEILRRDVHHPECWGVPADRPPPQPLVVRQQEAVVVGLEVLRLQPGGIGLRPGHRWAGHPALPPPELRAEAAHSPWEGVDPPLSGAGPVEPPFGLPAGALNAVLHQPLPLLGGEVATAQPVDRVHRIVGPHVEVKQGGQQGEVHQDQRAEQHWGDGHVGSGRGAGMLPPFGRGSPSGAVLRGVEDVSQGPSEHPLVLPPLAGHGHSSEKGYHSPPLAAGKVRFEQRLGGGCNPHTVLRKND
eukprot:RCo049589